MNVLFITRSCSKNKGGKEVYNYNLVKSLKKNNTIFTITMGGGSILHLLWFYPHTFLKSSYYLLTKKIDVIHFGDETEIEILENNGMFEEKDDNYEDNNRFKCGVLDGELGDNNEDNNRFKCEMVGSVR